MIKHRGYLISTSKEFPRSLTIAVEGRGGKIPNCLLGTYTSPTVAKDHINKYLDNRIKTDAKTISQS